MKIRPNLRKYLKYFLGIFCLGLLIIFILHQIYKAEETKYDVKAAEALAEKNNLHLLSSDEFAVIKQESGEPLGYKMTKSFTMPNGQTVSIETDKNTIFSTSIGQPNKSVFVPNDNTVTIFKMTDTEKSAGEKNKIDKDVYTKLNKSKSADVIVRLSGLETFYSQDDSAEKSKEKKDKFLAKKEQVKSQLGSNGKVKDDLLIINGFSAEANATGIGKLALDTNVDSVELEKVYQAALDTSVDEIRAREVWPVLDNNFNTLTGVGKTIAILDTGVDYTHADLGGCLGTNCKVIGGYDYINNDNDPMDDHGHGTHVAATAAGNGLYKGVAPDAKIMAYKVLASYGTGLTTGIIKAIQAATDPNKDGNPSDHVDVISMSLGAYGNPDDDLSLAVDNASAVGVVSTAAAGNSGPSASTILSPGTARSAITVAAACKSTQVGTNSYCSQPIASFSSRGPLIWNSVNIQKPDISAPGVLICAARWDSAFSGSPICSDEKHIRISGTSMATPHVAGAVALVRQAYPTYTPAQIKQLLKSTARNLGVSADLQGTGMIDVKAAIPIAPKINITPYLWTLTSDPTKKSSESSQTFTVSAVASDINTLSIAQNNTIAGVSFSFSKTSLSVANGRQDSFTAKITVDNDVAKAGNYLVNIQFSENNQLKGVIPASINIQPTFSVTNITADTIDFGNDYPNLPTWTATKQLSVKNMRSDISQTVNITSSTYSSGITFTATPANTSISPGATANIELKFTVNNSIVSNGIYSGSFTLGNNLSSVKLNTKFSKYYTITINNQNSNSTFVNWNNQSTVGSRGNIYLNGGQSYQLFLDQSGKYNLVTYSSGGNTAAYSLFKEGIDVSSGPANVTLNNQEATNKVNIIGVDQSGSQYTTSGNRELTFIYLPTKYIGGFVEIGQGTNSRYLTNISNNYRVDNLAITPQYNPKVYYFADSFTGLSGSRSTTISEGNMQKIAFQIDNNKPAGSSNQPLIYHHLSGTCCSSGAIINNNVVSQPVQYAYSSLPNDYYIAEIADYPQNAACPTPCASDYRSSYINPTTKERFVSLSSSTKVTPLSGDTIYNGLGPSLFAGKFANTTTSLRLTTPFREGYNVDIFVRQDFSEQEFNGVPYSIYKDGVLLVSGQTPSHNLSSDPHTWAVIQSVASGNYEFKINSFPYKIKGQDMTATVSAKFNNSLSDPNPPFIKRLYFFTNNTRSEVYNETVANRLEFELDPVGGSLNQPTVSYSLDGTNFTTATVNTGANGYTVNLPNLAGVSKLTLKMEAKDSSGNSLTYTFQLPRGDVPGGSNIDQIPPTVSIVSPTEGASVSGTISVTAEASDNVGIQKVEFYDDQSILVGTKTSSPYTINWNVGNTTGRRTITAKAFDTSGNSASATRSVNVVGSSSDTTPPTVSITYPSNGAILSRRQSISIQATANDNVAVTQVNFEANGATICGDNSAPYACSWTTPNRRGTYAITVKAFDAKSNVGIATITVTVK